MVPILKSEIFFFISSISVVVMTVILSIAGYYVIRTLQNIREISESLKRTAHTAESEFGELSERVTDSAFFSFIFGKKKKKK